VRETAGRTLVGIRACPHWPIGEVARIANPQDLVLHFDWRSFVDAKGQAIPFDAKGHPIPDDSVAGLQAFEGTIDRVSGVASISYTKVTPGPPNFLDRGTQYELLCKPVKPLF
jgi:hypothetical protein